MPSDLLTVMVIHHGSSIMMMMPKTERMISGRMRM